MSTKAESALKPWCPFCGMDVGRPTEAVQRKLREFPQGRCECGAVYVADATGHNVGAAMVECLVSACNDNWDMAWELIPEDDYLTGRLEDYDDVSHQIIQKRNLDGRAVRGVLYFVRLHGDMADLVQRIQTKKQAAGETGEAAGSQLAGQGGMPPAGPVVEPARDPKRKKQRADKKTVQRLAAEDNIDALVDLCFDDRRTLRFLQRLLYEPDPAIRYRIAWILGQVGGRLATREPAPVADLLHRLFEACADSAASSWGMVEAIGAIIAARPDIYGAFTRHLFAYMGDPGTREGVLWGLGEIAEARPELIRQIPFYSLFPVLNHDNPLYRASALRILEHIKAKEAGLQILGLQNDQTPVTLYIHGLPLHTTIADLALQASQNIHKEENHEH